jgi:DNA-binding XRE family transcriptional regulator
MNTCVNCGGTSFEAGGVTHTSQVGNRRIEDKSGIGTVCTNCGRAHLTLDALCALELRAANFLFHGDLGLIGGAELRAARKMLGLRQVDLAERLEKRAETISRYETGADPIPVEFKLSLASLIARKLHHGDEQLELNKSASQGGEFRIAS